jgi:hypothetical protein
VGFIVRPGDLVRFKYTGALVEEWKIGLLLEYHKWEKVATILYQSSEVRVRASLIQIDQRAKINKNKLD